MSEKTLNKFVEMLLMGESSKALKRAQYNSAKAVWKATTLKMFPHLRGSFNYE